MTATQNPTDRAAEDRQRQRRAALRDGQPLHRRDGEGVPLHSRPAEIDGDHRARPRRLPGVAPPPGRGARRRRPPGRRADGRAPGRARRPRSPREMGKRIEEATGELYLCSMHPQLLRRQRPRLPRADVDRAADGQGRGRRRDAADRRPAGHRAVELPLLPGRPRGRPEPGAGQHGHPQARRDQPAVRPGDREAVHRRRRARGRLHQHLPAHRRRRAGHRRPAGSRA